MLRRDVLLGAAALAVNAAAPSPLLADRADDSELFRGFGPDFAWGVSTSAYQIEGAVDVDGRGASIWDMFARVKGNIRGNETAVIAADHYRRYRSDIALVAGGGFRNYRLSISWPRIMPAGTGAVNARGLDFYDRVVDQCLQRGVTPWICLYHWDLPQALQERGGWLDRRIGHWFAEYATAVSRRLGDRVKHWAMINEAAVHAVIGHGFGAHAPGLRGRASYAAAMHHQNLAQGLAIAALRAERGDYRLGTVMCLEPIRSATPRDRDVAAARYFEAIWKGASIDPLLKGTYPELLAEEFAPLIRGDDMAAIRQPIDFLGMNYYSELHIQSDERSPLGVTFGPPPPGSVLTAMGWPIEPQGLYRQLIELRDHYGNPPIYIAENGAAFADQVDADGQVHDPGRVGYFRVHLRAALQAMRQGAALRGFFIWSLLDNFEWTEGTTKRFGIVYVDFDTLTRTPKASYTWFANGLNWHG